MAEFGNPANRVPANGPIVEAAKRAADRRSSVVERVHFAAEVTSEIRQDGWRAGGVPTYCGDARRAETKPHAYARCVDVDDSAAGETWRYLQRRGGCPRRIPAYGLFAAETGGCQSHRDARVIDCQNEGGRKSAGSAEVPQLNRFRRTPAQGAPVHQIA
jgi:hypothetical protein